MRVIIIGGGPGGYTAGLTVARLGGDVILIEAKDVGGVCLNEGCIPTKALIRSCEVLKEINRAEEFGINVTNIGHDFERIFKRKEEVVIRARKGLISLLKNNGVKIIEGKARLISSKDRYGSLKVSDIAVIVNNEEIKADSIIIATGSRELIPKDLLSPSSYPLPSREKEFMTSSEVLSLSSAPESLLIVGGGVTGIEFAYIFNTFGTEVTIVEQMETLVPNLQDKESVKLLKESLEKEGIKVLTGEKVVNISKEGSRYICSLQGGKGVEAEKVLVAVGRVPNIDGLEEIGIEIDKGRIKVNEYMETNIEGIYAIGDVVGPPFLAHKAFYEGVVVGRNIMGIKEKINYSAVPNCIYCSPEIAWVGELEGDKVGMFSYAGNPRALCIGERRGFVKVFADKKGVVVGMEVVGKDAGEFISIGTVAIKNRLKAKDLGEIVYPHPSLSESLKEAFLKVEG